MVDQVVIWIASIVLSAVLIHGGVHKLRARAVFTATLRDYELLPAALVPMTGFLLPWVELVAAVGLLVPASRPAGAIMACGLLGVYTFAMGINMLRGRRYIDCGCAGPANRQPISYWLLLRNALLVCLALPLLTASAARGLVWMDYFTVVAGSAALIVLYGVGNALAANQPRSLVIQNG